MVSCKVVGSEGKALLEKGNWFGLIKAGSESQLVEGPPRFRPAGSESPHEGTFSVLSPKGIKHRALFWIQGDGLKPGPLLTGKVIPAKPRFPKSMQGAFADSPILIKSTVATGGTWTLSVSNGAGDFQVIRGKEFDPENTGWHLVWMGDINRDGLLDLVIEIQAFMSLRTVLLIGQKDGSYLMAASDTEFWD